MRDKIIEALAFLLAMVILAGIVYGAIIICFNMLDGEQDEQVKWLKEKGYLK